MSNKWDEQDDAFFGKVHDPQKSSSSTDEEIAKKLQQQYIDEQKRGRRSKQKNQDFAHRRNNQDSHPSGGGTFVSFGGKRAHGSAARNTNNNQGFMQPFFRNDDRTKKEQENKDAALARQMQEEEEKQFNDARQQSQQQQRPQHAASDSPNLRSWLGGPEVYPGRRRGGLFGGIVPTCAVCQQMVMMPISALGNQYHAECFRCMGCHEKININESFACAEGENGVKYPMHRQCYAELYGLVCTVCRQTMQADSSGRVSYKKHPFFDTEYMCSKHSEESTRRCTGCFRFEPNDLPFANLNDNGRCVCDACLRSVVVDSEDAKPLWDNVIRFLEHHLKLPIWSSMKEIPILIVGHEALNEQMGGHGHGGSSQFTTRGLCLSEHQRGFNFLLPRMKFNRKQLSFVPSDAKSDGYTHFQIPKSSHANPNSAVTAILCLSGLPADLTASILAHEATHAWIKLHPQYEVSKPIPPQVEEGCCQLLAMLFLNDGLPQLTQEQCNNSNEGPSTKQLRQYFKYAIETDSSDIYGEGYRKAALAYSKIGVEALLSHVVTYQEFPKL